MEARIKKLDAAIQELIIKHGASNPELLRDLQAMLLEVRATAGAKRNSKDVAKLALRIATWVKLLYDLVSDDDSP